MIHFIDMTTDELRMLYAALPVNKPFEDLKPLIQKMERLLEIAKQAESK